jgi:hypothetical protein
VHTARVFLFTKSIQWGEMHFVLIKNPDASMKLAYSTARVIYAQTGATSLPLVEAVASTIANASVKNNRSISDIISDSCFFEVLNHESENHNRLYQEPASRGFQMCLRVATRMLHGTLPDCVFGATRFHHANTLPDWAMSRGYIADIDNFLFYI